LNDQQWGGKTGEGVAYKSRIMGKPQLLRVLLLPGLQVAEFSYLHNLYTSAFCKKGNAKKL
jgi:hypothetical protein